MLSILGYFGYRLLTPMTDEVSGAPPGGVAWEEVPQDLDPYAFAWNWTRPEGPVRVGIQVGHWKNDEVPEELEKLKRNGGASGGGKTEAEVNLVIAQQLEKLLTDEGYKVDVLPTTVPAGYWADVFVAIHADGSEDPTTSGFKMAGPWRDFTHRSDALINHLTKHYQAEIGMDIDPSISRNMRGYYAFSWWKFEHAIHPMTTAVIVETGFLTNAGDRKIIVDQPEVVARALAGGIVEYIQKTDLS